MRRSLAPIAVAPLAALLVSGCLGGLLGGKPAQMYRFGAPSSPIPAGPELLATRAIRLEPVEFAAEIDTDRLLASHDGQTMYVKGARWTSTAADLFTAALRDAFRRRAPAVAVVDGKAAGAAAPSLRVAISRFEARYTTTGKAAVPEIRIEGEAVLTDAAGRFPGARFRIGVSRPAASGRIADIVAAFDAADAQAVDAVADWAAARRP